MPDQSNELSDSRALEAAYLYAQRNSQIQIAHFLGISQASVSRLLGNARQLGILRETLFLSAAQKNELEQAIYPRWAALRQVVDRLTPRKRYVALRVLNSGSTATDPAAYDDRIRQFTELAADHMDKLLQKKPAYVGLAWGVTLARFVAGVRRYYAQPPTITRKLKIFPICGEPLESPQYKGAATAVASELNEVLNLKGSPEVPSLSGVPAWIPHEFQGRDMDCIRRYIRHALGHRQVFGPNPKSSQLPLINQMDTVLTSVGTASAPFKDPLLEDASRAVGISVEELADLTLGNIAGVFLPRPGKSHDIVDELNDRCVGATRDHLLQCAKSAAKKGRCGVVVLAISKAKAAIVAECISLGMVNELLIDFDLADGLIELA